MTSDLPPQLSSPTKTLCIGFLGADWWGSDARAMAAEFRRRGHLVLERHYEDHLPTRWRHPLLRAVRRILRGVIARDYNRSVSELLEVDGMDFLLVFKGMLLAPETLARFRARGTACYCFYPDVSFYDHGGNISGCLPWYDCVFTTKKYHLENETLWRLAREWRFAPHGFDPEVHRPVMATGAGLQQYACDLSFVGQWSAKKERSLSVLRQRLPESDLRIWGPDWTRAAAEVRACWQGRGAHGDELAAIYSLSKINLGLLSGAGSGGRQGDATTARSWQIPGVGGFLLHEDTPEIRESFEAETEVALFDGPEQLIAQVRRYLADDAARRAVAAAGHRRAMDTPYTYGRAVDQILARHHTAVLERGLTTARNECRQHPGKQPVRAVYVGILTEGTTSRQRAERLRLLRPQWDWTWVDTDEPMRARSRFWRSLAFRMYVGPVVDAINAQVASRLRDQTFDLIWVDKAVYLRENTTRQLRAMSNCLVHFTLDTAFYQNNSRFFRRSLPLYDLVVTTKSFELEEYARRTKRERIALTTQGFAKAVHFPRVDDAQRRREVVFVGLAEPDREHCVETLLRGGIPVRLAGHGWGRFLRKWGKHPLLSYEGTGVFGEAYAAMLGRAWVGLGLMSKRFPERHTTRTFEIPACGTILASERTSDTTQYFAEEEVIFFDDYPQLATQLKHLFATATDAELAELATAGRQRVLRDGRDYATILGYLLEHPRIRLGMGKS